MRWLVGITGSMDMDLSKLWEMGKDRGACWTAVYGVTQSRTRLTRLSKITADGDCSHEIKRCLLLGRKAMTNSVLKNRDITLPTL